MLKDRFEIVEFTEAGERVLSDAFASAADAYTAVTFDIHLSQGLRPGVRMMQVRDARTKEWACEWKRKAAESLSA